MQTEVVGLRTPNPAGYPRLRLRSGEYDAHSSAAMKSGVFCRRNCCVTFARCDGKLSCMNSKFFARIKEYDIQAVRKSSTYQCNSSGQLLFSAD